MTAYRPMIESDIDFVVSGWSSSLRTSRHAGLIAMDRWADVMHAEIATILARPSTAVTVACQPGEVDHLGRPFLYGFAATRTDLAAPYLYYVYIKEPYRRGRARLGLPLGHAEALLAAAGIDLTRAFSFACRTPIGDQLLPRVPFATWDPLPARFERPHEQREQQEQGRRRRRGAR